MKSFLQTKDWADFQNSLGHKIWQIDGILIIQHCLPFNKNYLYSPRLCFSDFKEQVHFKGWINEIKQIAEKEKAIFLKLEFKDNIDKKNLKGFKKSYNIQFQKTIILDIRKSEQELLKSFHQKTRYNIRLAQKKNIKIKRDKKYFKDFWILIQKTAQRDNFHTHLENHYKNLLKIPGIELFVAEIDNKIISANIVLFYKNQAIYLHGASDYNYRNLMAPYLLQWEQIKEAKKKGCVKYDFWGIDEKKWPGVTRFKKGFKGKEIKYPCAYDLVFNDFWYKIYKIAKKLL